MKMSASPMPDAKAAAVAEINSRFAAASNPFRDQAHRRKRELAAAVTGGAQPTPEFAAEAAMRAMTVQDFAALIDSKPDPIDARELARQQALFAVDAAKSPAEIATILSGLQG